MKSPLLTNQIDLNETGVWVCPCVCAREWVIYKAKQFSLNTYVMHYFSALSTLAHVEKTMSFAWNMGKHINLLLQIEVTGLEAIATLCLPHHKHCICIDKMTLLYYKKKKNSITTDDFKNQKSPEIPLTQR